MRKVGNFIALLVLSFLSIFTYSCTNSKTVTKEIEVIQEDGKSLLWKVTGKDAKTSYLYGTIHIICPEDMNISKEIKNSFEKTEELVLEIDMDEPGMMTDMQDKVMLKEGESLKNYFTEEEYAKLNEFLDSKLGIPAAVTEKMSLLGLTSTLSMKMIDCIMPASYEMSLMSMAKAKDMEITGVESVEDQLAAFEKLDIESQKKNLMQMVNNFDSAKIEFTKMVEAYKDNDLNSLLKAIQSQEQDTKGQEGGFMDVMLTERNKRWIPVMSEKMKTKACFFAVGAGHLAGDNGVIELLKKEGYKVEAIKVTPKSSTEESKK